MPRFLVEIYPSANAGEELTYLMGRTQAAVKAARAEGISVELIDASFLPSDETCLLMFDGPSEGVVTEVASAAGLLTEVRGGSVKQLVDLVSEEDQP